MVKVVIFLALLISFVYSKNEDDFSGSNLASGEIQTKSDENIVHPNKDLSIEEKRVTKPCTVDVYLSSNNDESEASTQKDAGVKTTSINNLNAINKIPSNLINFESMTGSNDPTINKESKKRASIDDIHEDTLPKRRLLLGIKENLTKLQSEDNKLSRDKPLHDEDNIWNHRNNLFANIDEISNSFDSEKIKKRDINELSAQEAISEDSVENKFIDPAIGKGIYDMKNTKVMLLENTRVCYACSTMSNPTCWSPDKQTTVKYCQKGHQSCLTTTFQHKGTSLIIRDCGSSCESQNAKEKYSACTTCHTDLCNGASTVINTSVAMIVLLGILFSRQ